MMSMMATSFEEINAGSIISNKVFVGGLAEQTETKDLREMFQAYAPVQDVKIIVDRSVTSKSGDPRRYAFIAFDSMDDVKKVLTELNDKSLDLHGRRLTVGQAYRKSTANRNMLGVPNYAGMIPDPYLMYRAMAMGMSTPGAWTPYSPKMQPLNSPYNPYPSHMYASPYANMDTSGFMGAQQQMMYSSLPSSPTTVMQSPACHMTYGTPQQGTINFKNLNDNNQGPHSGTPEDPNSSEVFRRFKQQQQNLAEFQNLDQQRAGNAGRAYGIGQPIRVTPSSGQNGAGMHYIHQGPTAPIIPRQFV